MRCAALRTHWSCLRLILMDERRHDNCQRRDSPLCGRLGNADAFGGGETACIGVTMARTATARVEVKPALLRRARERASLKSANLVRRFPRLAE